MTDTASPFTGPHLTPMFATGAQPAISPNTEPNPAPIFDTGPHPDPLNSNSADASDASESVEAESGAGSDDWASAEWDSDEWRAAKWRNPDSETVDGAEPEPESASEEVHPESVSEEPEPASASEEVDPESVSEEPEPASASEEIDPDLNLVLDAIDGEPQAPIPQAFSELENVDTDAFLRSVTGHMPPVVVPAQPVAVPGAFQFVKRWKFALIVAGVWVVAAAAGLGFYYWWYTDLVKTLPVFGILLYLTLCMVASLLVSMVPDRPQVAALSIALMAAPLASMAAAAVLHGAYYFEWIARPVIG